MTTFRNKQLKRLGNTQAFTIPKAYINTNDINFQDYYKVTVEKEANPNEQRNQTNTNIRKSNTNPKTDKKTDH
jgi:antitoxin component of MazEF toxin-antitoxin module